MAVVRVVLGPRTRLGADLLAHPPADRRTAVVVRSAADRAALAPVLDGDRVVALDADAPDTASLLGDGCPAVEVVIAALGPVHPDDGADLAAAHAAVVRDLGVLASVLDAVGTTPVGVALVSSVIALAPGDDRRRYGGWKNLVEAEVAALVAAHPSARLTVLYPGRLLDATQRRRPWHRLHTSYDALSARVEDALAGGTTSRVVGADARLWLAARAARFALGALRPGPAARD